MKMKKYALLSAVAVMAIALTSCKKEPISPANSKNPESVKRPMQGGIKSIDTWAVNNCSIDRFGVTAWGQLTDVSGNFGPTSGTSSLYTFGASGDYEAFMYLDGSSYRIAYDVANTGTAADMAITFSGSIAGVEEIEVNPADHEIYALVKMNRSGQMGLYHVDLNFASANLVGTLHAAGAGSTGSIAFVPNGISGYKLLYVYEPVANTSAVMNYYTLPTTTTLSSLSSVSISGNFVPGTGGLNICYGNLRLFFSRDAGDLYQINGTSLPTSGTVSPFGTVAESDANFANRYDFGYYGT